MTPLDAVLAEFTAAWDRGDAPRAEDFADRVPPGDLVELVYHEFCLADLGGLAPSCEDFLARFPGQADALSELFRVHAGTPRSGLSLWSDDGLDFGSFGEVEESDLDPLPQAGDEIGPYHLLRELGSGAFARVFLAEQLNFERRLAVVKASTRVTPEPNLLAKARHPNIVEVYWHGLVSDGGLQILCMPFLGGAPLSALLADRRRRKARPATGGDLLAELDRAADPEYHAPSSSRLARELLSTMSYPRAAAWVVARLAEALDFAFVQGVVHGDVKPSNVLLTADATPMLFDFNLAVGWEPLASPGSAPGREGVEQGGGTLAYMAPERLRAVAEPGPAPSPTAADRHRADVYSLGVVLLELLTGRPPELPGSNGRGLSARRLASAYFTSRVQGSGVMLRAARARVAPSLRAILDKCLAADPADRYRRASELALDLDAWRTDRPLVVAAEPALRFGLVRWAHRQRVTILACALGVVVSAAATALAWRQTDAERRAKLPTRSSQLADTRDFRQRRAGSNLVKGDASDAAKRKLETYGVLGRDDWRDRDEFRALPAAEREELEVWLLEQALRFAHALGSRPDAPADWQRGLACVERVAAARPVAPLLAQSETLRAKLGPAAGTPPAPQSGGKPPRWMEDYLAGVASELRGEHHNALAHYQAVLKSRPHSFWAGYRAAAVAFALREFDTATVRLKACVDQRSDCPILRNQLAACLYETGRYQEASAQYEEGQRLDPDQAELFLSRTFLRVKLFQTAGYLDDLARYETLKGRRPRHSPGDPLLDLTAGAVGEADDLGEFSAAGRTAVPPDRDEIAVRVGLAGQLSSAGQHELAFDQLDWVLAADPDNLQARFGRGCEVVHLARGDGGRDFALVLAHPRFKRYLHDRPEVIYAFQWEVRDLIGRGRPLDALDSARRGLTLLGPGRAALAGSNPSLLAESHYRLASACALAASDGSDPRLRDEADEHYNLARRLDEDYVKKCIRADVPLRRFLGLPDEPAASEP